MSGRILVDDDVVRGHRSEISDVFPLSMVRHHPERSHFESCCATGISVRKLISDFTKIYDDYLALIKFEKDHDYRRIALLKQLYESKNARFGQKITESKKELVNQKYLMSIITGLIVIYMM